MYLWCRVLFGVVTQCTVWYSIALFRGVLRCIVQLFSINQIYLNLTLCCVELGTME
jgi:hypothetical protein